MKDLEIKLKPISINMCWQGRRFKTQDYKNFRQAFEYLCKSQETNEDKDITVKMTFYIKNYAMSDVDNLIKPTLDALVDNRIIKDDRYIKTVIATKEKSEDERIVISIQ